MTPPESGRPSSVAGPSKGSDPAAQLLTHPQIPCSRCGAFIASPGERPPTAHAGGGLERANQNELTLLDGKSFCATCAARPDVNYLETFRLKYWGKRDGWAWFVGFAGILGLLNVGQAATAGQYAAAITGLAACAINICFFLGLRWARYGLLAIILISLALAVASAPEEARGMIAVTFVLPLAVAVAVLNDTRNQLFFKVQIPRAKLQKAWDLYMNNTVARAGFMLALTGVLFPPVRAARVDRVDHRPAQRRPELHAAHRSQGPGDRRNRDLLADRAHVGRRAAQLLRQ